MSRTTVVGAAVVGTVLVAALSAGGGGGDSAGGGATGDKVNLVFRQFDPAGEIGGLQQAVDTWNKDNPSIHVELQTLSPSNVQQFAREANSGSGPDVNVVGYADVSFVAKSSILTPLDELMKNDPMTGSKDDLLATDMVTFDNKMWAMPWTADTFALTYRPDALQQAGISAPPTTWEQLAEDATKISSSTGGKTAGFCFPGAGSATSGQWFAINYYLWSHNSGLASKDASGQIKPLATPSDISGAMDYFNGLFTSGATPKSFLTVSDYTDPSITGGLATGTCAMSYLPPQTVRAVVKQQKGQVLTAPMPDGLKDGATHLGGRALAINAHTESPEAAWKFVKFLTSAATFATYNQYPASKSTLSALKVPESEQGFVQQLPHSQSFARYINPKMPISAMQQLVDQQFSAVYSGQTASSGAAQAVVDGIAKGIQGS
jgi:multiple sugar transport system substrate-binding protein